MRMFEIIDKLNQLDTDNGGKRVAVFPDIIDVNSGKLNGKVTVGVPSEFARELMNTMVFGNGNKKALLLIIDMDEYNKIKS